MDSWFSANVSRGRSPLHQCFNFNCSGVYQRLILLEAVGRIRRLSSHISVMCSASEGLLLATCKWILGCSSVVFPVFFVFSASIHRHQLELNSSKDADIYIIHIIDISITSIIGGSSFWPTFRWLDSIFIRAPTSAALEFSEVDTPGSCR